jgi:hypothetical protein
MDNMDRLEKALADMAEQNKRSTDEHNLRMAELDKGMLKFENGLQHLLEVSARNEELIGKIGALVIQHEDRIKRLEGR